MAAAYGSSTVTIQSSGGSTIVCNKPSSTAADDILVAIMFADSDANTTRLTAPSSSWAQIGSTGFTSSCAYGKVWVLLASASEPSTYTFGCDPAAETEVFLVRVTGGNIDGSAVEVLSWGGSSTSSNSHVAPSISTGTNAVLEIAAFCGVKSSGTRSYTPPSGMTEAQDSSSGSWIFACLDYLALPSGGSTGTRTATCGTSARSLTVNLAVNSANESTVDAPTGAESVTWLDPGGTSWTLATEWNVKGRFMPGIEFEEDGSPEQPGSTVRAVRHGVHEFSYMCWFESSTETALRTQMRDLVYAMDPTRGDGRIRVQDQMGSQREIYCRYAGGLDMDEVLGDMSGPLIQKADIKFRASDPYYYDVSATTSTYTTGTPPAFFPFFPLRIAASEVFTETTITVNGDVECWPVWTLSGQGSDLTVLNETTGKSFTLVQSFITGEGVVIDTRPGVKTVTSLNGTNLFPNLTDDSALFSLVPGPNILSIQLGASNTETTVTCVYRNRYLSP